MRAFWAISLVAAACLMAEDANWPQFRGPRGDGTSNSKGLPVRWSETENIRWKTPIHGRAWSSPVIWKDQLWMTTATEDGRELGVVCVDPKEGKILKDLRLFEVETPQAIHKFNTYASPTPVVEEGRLYVSFGSPGLACLDTTTGKVLWERRDFVCNHYRGAGSSPIVHQNLLIQNFDGSDLQYIVALDKETGKTVWKKDRSIDYKDLDADGKPQTEGDFRKAFATCHVAELDGVPTLLSQGSKALYGYDPGTGRERWRVEERNNYSGSTRLLVAHGLIFLPSGFSSGQLLALRPGKDGEVLDANVDPPADSQLRVVWRSKRNVPKKTSLQLVGDLLFGLDDIGVATCWDAKTGKVHWNERVGGDYSASPLAAEGRVYFFSESGKTVVVAASPDFQKLAENQLGDGFMASPAVSGKALFLRSRTQLYRVETP